MDNSHLTERRTLLATIERLKSEAHAAKSASFAWGRAYGRAISAHSTWMRDHITTVSWWRRALLWLAGISRAKAREHGERVEKLFASR